MNDVPAEAFVAADEAVAAPAVSVPAVREKLPDFLELTIDGRLYRFGRVGSGIKLNAEEEIRKQRRAEFKAVMESLATVPDDQKQTAVLAAFDHLLRNITVSQSEVRQWLSGSSGEVFQAWRSLQASEPDATYEQARQLFERMSADDVARLSDFLVMKHMGM